MGIKNTIVFPSCYGSVGWASSCKPKDHGFNSQSGHMHGLGVWSPVGVHRRGNQSMFLSHIGVSLPLFLSPSLSPSLALSLESIKEKKLIKQRIP